MAVKASSMISPEGVKGVTTAGTKPLSVSLVSLIIGASSESCQRSAEDSAGLGVKDH